MANNVLAVTQLDFTGIKDSLKTFLRNYPQFMDYDFEGSNLGTLLDVLSYNTYLNSFYTNQAINEMFLDTAVLRDSVVSHAKELNYLPRSARSAEAKIDLTIYPTDSPATITIPSGTKFTGSSGQSVYTFQTNEAIVITPYNNTYTANAVSIFEGTTVTENFIVNTAITDQRYILSNPNIDTTSLIISVSNSTGSSETWTFSPSLLNVTTTSKIYFLQATADKYEVLFGDNIAGLYPPNNGTITATYRTCNQDSPNGIKAFKAAQNLGGYSNFFVTTSKDANNLIISATGGASPESVGSIKLNAPRAFQTLERAVTANDYKNILFNAYPEIRAINVYGGEELSPPQYGRVYISVDVTNVVGLSDTEKNKIQSFISTRTPISISPVVVAPDYTFASVVTDVQYNYNTSTLSPADIQSAVLSAISAYNNASLINFNTKLRYSKLVAAIDGADVSITQSNTRVMIFKKINPTLSTNYSVALDYQNTLVAGTVTSSGFTYAGVAATFRDDGAGKIQIITTLNNVVTVLNNSVGTIDYTTGIINLVNLNVSEYVGNAINIFAETDLSDFSAVRNTILEIDANEVTINVTGVRQ